MSFVLPTRPEERFRCVRLHCVLSAGACVARQDARKKAGMHSLPVHRACAPDKPDGAYPCAQGREVRAALLEAARRPPEPTIESLKEDVMETKKTCEQCGRALRADSQQGRCWYCRAGKAPKPRTCKTSTVVPGPTPLTPVTHSLELPPVEQLPAAYLARCVLEARRRVAGIDELMAVLKGAA